MLKNYIKKGTLVWMAFGLLGAITPVHASRKLLFVYGDTVSEKLPQRRNPWGAFFHPTSGYQNEILQPFVEKKSKKQIATVGDSPLLTDMGYMADTQFPAEHLPLKVGFARAYPHANVTSFGHTHPQIPLFPHGSYGKANISGFDLKPNFDSYPIKGTPHQKWYQYDLVLGRNLFDGRYKPRSNSSGKPLSTPDPVVVFEIAHSMLKDKRSSAILHATKGMDIPTLEGAVSRFNLQQPKSKQSHKVQASMIEIPYNGGAYVHIGTPEARTAIGWGQ